MDLIGCPKSNSRLDAGVAGWPVATPTPPRDTALEGTPLGTQIILVSVNLLVKASVDCDPNRTSSEPPSP